MTLPPALGFPFTKMPRRSLENLLAGVVSRMSAASVVPWPLWEATFTAFRAALDSPDPSAMASLLGEADGVRSPRVEQVPVGWLGRLLGSQPGVEWTWEMGEMLEATLDRIRVSHFEVSCRTSGIERAALLANALVEHGHPEAADLLVSVTGSQGEPDLAGYLGIDGVVRMPPPACAVLRAALADVPSDPGWALPLEELRRGLPADDDQGVVWVQEI